MCEQKPNALADESCIPKPLLRRLSCCCPEHPDPRQGAPTSRLSRQYCQRRVTLPAYPRFLKDRTKFRSPLTIRRRLKLLPDLARSYPDPLPIWPQYSESFSPCLDDCQILIGSDPDERRRYHIPREGRQGCVALDRLEVHLFGSAVDELAASLGQGRRR
jgi:hypothetical protein